MDLMPFSPKAPLEFAEDGNLSMKITKEADYIAKI